VKRADDHIEAFCPAYHDVETIVSGWQGTVAADGPMEPCLLTTD